MKNVINKLVRLANHLDSKGLTKEADYLDSIIRKADQQPRPNDVTEMIPNIGDIAEMIPDLEDLSSIIMGGGLSLITCIAGHLPPVPTEGQPAPTLPDAQSLALNICRCLKDNNIPVEQASNAWDTAKRMFSNQIPENMQPHIRLIDSAIQAAITACTEDEEPPLQLP